MSKLVTVWSGKLMGFEAVPLDVTVSIDWSVTVWSDVIIIIYSNIIYKYFISESLALLRKLD